MSPSESWSTLVDGHRVCLYCEMLERGQWPHPYPPDPWLCHECVGRSRYDAGFARRVHGQLAYSASELDDQTTELAVNTALAYYTAVWYATEEGRRARKEWEKHELPF